MLKLKKPLAIFDLETTGVNVASDRIVEISIVKISPNGEKEIKTKRINPIIPIPLEASLVHGIYDGDVINEPKFNQIGKSLAQFLQGCDLGGYNCLRFDIPILMEEFLRNEIDFDLNHRNIVDVQNIFHQMEPRTLKAAYKFYCQKELINAHSAEADTVATYEVLLEQIKKYENVEIEDSKGNKIVPVQNDMEILSKFSANKPFVDFAGRMVFDDKGIEVFNFGKHKGKIVEEIFKVEPSYYDWMMKGEFPLYTKKKLTEIRLRMKFVK